MTPLDRLAAQVEAVELEQRLVAMRADRSAGLVPPDVRRPLYAHELVAHTNFAEIDDHVTTQAAQLARRVRADRERLIRLLDADLRATSLRPGPMSQLARMANRLFDLDGPGGLTQLPGADRLLSDAEIYHRGRLTVAATRAAQQVLTEARAQGLPVAEDAVVKFEDLQAEQLDLLARRVAQAPHVDLLRALRDQVVLEEKDFVTADELVDRLAAHARGLSPSPLDDVARSGVQQADSIGRVVGATHTPTPKAIYASELLDRTTCGPCSLIDGHEYGSMADARRDYPHGTYIRCEGGLRCRGTLVFVWPTEADPTLQTPGDQEAPATTATGDLIDPAERLHVPAPTSGNARRDDAARELADVNTVIAGLHQIPDTAIPVSVHIGTGLPYRGVFDPNRNAGRVLLEVDATIPDPGFTYAHEVGHYIDIEILGTRQATSAARASELVDVMAAIDRSAAVAELRSEALDPATDSARATFINGYLLDPAELWARAYSQWIAERSGDRALLGHLGDRLQTEGARQWETADFASIGDQIDAVMVQLGFRP